MAFDTSAFETAWEPKEVTSFAADPFRTADFDELDVVPEAWLQMGPCSFTKANEKAQHLHTVARTDRALAQELRAEVDQLDKELRRLDLEGLEFPARRLQELDVQLEAMHLEDCVKLFLQLSSQDTKDLEKLQVQRLAKERDLEDGMSHGAFFMATGWKAAAGEAQRSTWQCQPGELILTARPEPLDGGP